MCGIAGIISSAPIDPSACAAMRDALATRGPDDATMAELPGVTLGHRRLRVMDPTSAGDQPMTTPDGRWTIVYNGELYNDAELRRELRSLGVVFRSVCDTETVLHAIAAWGLGACDRLRGMYALAAVDRRERVCLLARDPMGIKPLYTARLGSGDEGALLLASEVRGILAHPRVEPSPDPVAMSAYASNIRPGFGSRTLFEGIEAHEPGRWSLVSMDDQRVVETRLVSPDDGGGVDATRAVIEGSIDAHLRSDVPMCALLSGGLDSAIIASVAHARLGRLHTFCAGARTEGFDDDFAHARGLAGTLGTDHTEVEVTREVFLDRWVSMIDDTRVPLSTPNEVAIDRVARALRGRGFVVALSGEGADELFGGYAVPMMQAEAFARAAPDSDRTAGHFHLASNAWMSAEHKRAALTPGWLDGTDDDEELASWYQSVYDGIRAKTDGPLEAHRRFHERVNLANLLRRLDSATMLHGVEGRTPFADRAVSAHAAALPMHRKFIGGDEPRTKIALREAFRDALPDPIVRRPKASFPLPFQSWVGGMTRVLERSSFARDHFTPEAIGAVSAEPERLWNLAWPMLNLTLWGERVWGDATLGRDALEEAIAQPAS